MWFNRLRHRFSPRRIRLGHDGIQPLAGGESDAVVCLVGRELCLFIEVNAEKVPVKQRPAFAATAVRRHAPFPDPDFGLNWEGGHACIWYWSRARVQDLLEQPPSRIKYVPEALFVDQAHVDHVQLLALKEGVEGRVWKQGRLVASRWWPASPELSSWSSFLRGAGIALDAGTGVPEPETSAIATAQWSTSRTKQGLLLPEVGPYLPRLLLASALTMVLVFGWEVGSIVRAQTDTWRARAAAEDMDDALRRILEARSHADTYRTEIDQLLALRQGVPQNRLLAEYARLAAGKEWQIKLWQQPAPDQLEVTLAMKDPDPEVLVSAWEASPLLKDVSTELSRQQNEVTMKAAIEQDAANTSSPIADPQAPARAEAPTPAVQAATSPKPTAPATTSPAPSAPAVAPPARPVAEPPRTTAPSFTTGQ